MKKFLLILLTLVGLSACNWGSDPVPEVEEGISYCEAIEAERLANLNKFCPYYPDFAGCECSSWSGVKRSNSLVGQGKTDPKNFYDYSRSDDYRYYYDVTTGQIRSNLYRKADYVSTSRADAYIDARLDYMTGKRKVDSLVGVDTVSREGYLEYYGDNQAGVLNQGYVENYGGDVRSEGYLSVYGDRSGQNESYLRLQRGSEGGRLESYVAVNNGNGEPLNESYTHNYGDVYREDEQYLSRFHSEVLRNETYSDYYGDAVRNEGYVTGRTASGQVAEGYLQSGKGANGAPWDHDYLNVYGDYIVSEKSYVDVAGFDNRRVEEYTALKGGRVEPRVESYL